MASVIPNQRFSRTDDLFKSIGSSSSAHNSDINNSKKKWSSWVPLCVGLVVIAEIAFLGKLDMAKNADLVNSWADSFYQFTTSSWFPTSTYSAIDGGGDEAGLGVLSGGVEQDGVKLEDSCEKWLEKEDSVVYSRDFEREPVFVTGAEQEWKSCAVRCKFGFDSNKKPDAAFGLPQQGGASSVLRSMESAQYYAENNIEMARRVFLNL